MEKQNLKDMAYDISASVEEALMCLEDIKDEWWQEKECNTSLISVAMDELKRAYIKARKLEDMI